MSLIMRSVEYIKRKSVFGTIHPSPSEHASTYMSTLVKVEHRNEMDKGGITIPTTRIGAINDYVI